MITDQSNVETAFHISNCHWSASSIFDLGGHQQMYPGVIYEQAITICSTTLDDALSRIAGALRQNALVMDVQGAEVVVLRGATKSLRQFQWVFAECADFEIYRNGCTYKQLETFLESVGFTERERHLKESRDDLGSTYDVLFVRA